MLSNLGDDLIGMASSLPGWKVRGLSSCPSKGPASLVAAQGTNPQERLRRH